MEEFMGDSPIENFTIPFTAVASDIIKQKEIYYRSGSLFKALRSSIAIPTLFTPVVEGESQLLDGGILNPLPLNLITRKENEIIVAVNVNANNIMPRKAHLLEVNEERAAYLRMLDNFRTQILKIDSKRKKISKSLACLI